MNDVWMVITSLGRDEVFIIALALYTWLVRPLGGRNLGVAFALSYLANTAVKYGLNLPRPFTHNLDIASEVARATAGGPGLPSGHTQMSMTLWGGIAMQIRRRSVWFGVLALVLLIAASRLILHVHYPSDIITGLLLGIGFAYLGTYGTFSQRGALRWLVPLSILILVTLLPVDTPHEYITALGLLAGFWYVQPTFSPPSTAVGRIIVGGLGLMIVLSVYFGLGAMLYDIKDVGIVRALRYAFLVLVATHGVPLLLRRWLPQETA